MPVPGPGWVSQPFIPINPGTGVVPTCQNWPEVLVHPRRPFAFVQLFQNVKIVGDFFHLLLSE